MGLGWGVETPEAGAETGGGLPGVALKPAMLIAVEMALSKRLSKVVMIVKMSIVELLSFVDNVMVSLVASQNQ